MIADNPDQSPRPQPEWLRIAEAELEGLYQLTGVIHAVLARRDGLCISAVPSGHPSEKRLSAVLAALLGTSDMAIREEGGGSFREVLLRSDNNEIICVAVGEDVVLGVVAEKGALTGLLLMAIESAALKIYEALRS